MNVQAGTVMRTGLLDAAQLTISRQASRREGAQPNTSPHDLLFFFFQAEDGIRDVAVTGVQTCALPISRQKKLLNLIMNLKQNQMMTNLMKRRIYQIFNKEPKKENGLQLGSLRYTDFKSEIQSRRQAPYTFQEDYYNNTWSINTPSGNRII